MITKTQAQSVLGQIYMLSYSNRIVRVRVSGQCQTWKRDQNRFRLPVKYGLYESGEITQDNGERFFLTVLEAIAMHPEAPLQAGIR